MAAGESKALRMVAGRGADENLVLAGLGHRLAQKVECASNLVGTNRGQILTLQPNRRAIPTAEMFIQLQRRFRKYLPHFPPRCFHKLLVHDSQSIEIHNGTRYAIGRRPRQRLISARQRTPGFIS
ncbi:hypothetical protein D3C72_773270 [compost metagenome]